MVVGLAFGQAGFKSAGVDYHIGSRIELAREVQEDASGETIEGEVAFIVPQASGQVGDAATFTVVINIGETELELLPGMTGRVEIQREAG